MRDSRRTLCADYNKLIGAQIRKARKLAKVRMKSAADILHTDLNHISMIEQGKRNIRACDLHLLSALYKQPIQFFFEI